MRRAVALITNDASEERIASIITVERISELGTIPSTIMMKAIRFSQTLVLKRALCRHIAEYGIPQKHISLAR
jgi:hypothetical protein